MALQPSTVGIRRLQRSTKSDTVGALQKRTSNSSDSVAFSTRTSFVLDLRSTGTERNGISPGGSTGTKIGNSETIAYLIWFFVKGMPPPRIRAEEFETIETRIRDKLEIRKSRGISRALIKVLSRLFCWIGYELYGENHLRRTKKLLTGPAIREIFSLPTVGNPLGIEDNPTKRRGGTCRRHLRGGLGIAIGNSSTTGNNGENTRLKGTREKKTKTNRKVLALKDKDTE